MKYSTDDVSLSLFSRTLTQNTIDEVDDASPLLSIPNSKTSDKESSKSNDDKSRKYGIFLTGVAAGTVAAGVWTYQDLKKESIQAAQVIVGNKDEAKSATPTRRERFNFIADVVSETSPALVFIEIKDLRMRDFYTGEPTTASNGSGFIVKEDGLIITNAHVVAGKPRAAIQVKLQDGRTYQGQVEDIDVKSDLATVRIDCQGLPVMKLGKSSNLRPGEFVIAMGSPLALSNTITTGVVSSVARKKTELGLRGGREVPDYIQTDAAITFGNSGGPLINLDGEAIGINSMKVTPGISFAIPIDYAKEFLQKSEGRKKSGVLTKQKAKRKFMGITMLAITPQVIGELRSRMQIPHNVYHGIVVFRMVHGSPADKAGIQPGDVITHINGNEMHTSGDVYELLEAEDVLEVELIRGVHRLHVTVRPEH